MERKRINEIVRPSAKPSTSRAIFQITNTVIPYLAILVIMYYMLINSVNYLFVLPVSVVGALFLVRIFILFHDCTHSSFVKSKLAMNIFGHIFGVLVFTSFNKWKNDHISHHQSVGNIDKRGTGDVWTMTVDEYQGSSFIKKLGYRLFRNPITLFIIGPTYIFLIKERLPINIKTKKEWFSFIVTNVSILAIILTVTFTIGFRYYLLIQLPIIVIAASLGVWLFFVQHQYEDVYWEESNNWNITEAALKGSSVYKLPAVLNWFTGSIGYHNIHHLNPRVPNYNLRKLFKRNKVFQESKQFKIFQSFQLAKLFLYDKANKKLISHRNYKKRYR